MDDRREYVDLMARRLAADRDRAIMQAIDDALGAGCWTMAAVIPRMERTGYMGRLYLLDGRPLIAIDPDESEPSWAEPSINLTFKAGFKVTRYRWQPAQLVA